MLSFFFFSKGQMYIDTILALLPNTVPEAREMLRRGTNAADMGAGLLGRMREREKTESEKGHVERKRKKRSAVFLPSSSVICISTGGGNNAESFVDESIRAPSRPELMPRFTSKIFRV